MRFRIKLSLLIFSFMFLTLQGVSSWTNMSGGYDIYLSPGETRNITALAKSLSGVDWYDPSKLWFLMRPDAGLNCGGSHCQVINNRTRIITGSVWATPNAIPGANGDLVLEHGTYPMGTSYGPAWHVVVQADQVPDECADAGDPVNAKDGTFSLESIDLSSEKPNGVNLIRTYKSRERNVYFQDNPEYEKLLRPFSEGGWTHNYVKLLFVMDTIYDDIYYKIRDGNEIRDVMLVKENGSDSISFADVYKVHRGLAEVDSNHWEYTKSDGSIEFYSQSDVFPRVALIDSVERFDETTLRFGYDDGDTLDYVVDKWGDSLKFYYEIYNSTFLLNKVEISGKDEWMEYKYLEFHSLFDYSVDSNEYFHRLAQIVKHTGDDLLIVLDRYYYNRNLISEVDTGVDVKSDIATQVFPQGGYYENNDTSFAAYDSLRLCGYRVNNWYGKYGDEGVYYQEIASGDTVLEKTYIERFYSGNHRVDSIYIYHWEDLRELGAHDPNDRDFTPTKDGYDYAEIIRYNPVGTRSSVTVAGKTTTYLSYDSDYNPLRIQKPNGEIVRYEYYQYSANGETRYSSYPTKIVYPGGDSVLNYYSQPDPDNPYYIRLEESIDEVGRSIVYTYDANNYTDEITLEDRYVAGEGVTDVVTDYDYNAVGNLLEVEDPEGTITYYEYSDNDNGPFLLKSGVDVGGDANQNNDILTFYTYNDMGEIEKKIEARINPSIMDTTEYEYDCLGKLSKVIHPNGDYGEFVYDKAGNLSSKKSLDTLGNSVVTHNYKSSPVGKLREVEENEGAGFTTKYDYSQDGKLIEFRNARDKDINYSYNQNKLVSTHYADGTKDSLGYYPCGCLLQFKEDRNGEVTEYVYDERSRIRSKLYYDDISHFNSSNPSDSLVYEYNKAGEIVKTTDKNGDICYSRDDVGNLDTVKVYSLYENVYQYDLSGRKTQLKSYKYGDPGQIYLEQTYQYDDAGRDTSTTADGKTWNLSYYDNNALKWIKYPEISGGTNRLSETYQIGSMGEITEISVLLDSATAPGSNLLENPGFETGNMNNWKGYSHSGETIWYVDSLDNIFEFSCGDTTGGGTVSHSWQVNNSDPKEGTYSLYSPYDPPQSYADVEFAIQRFEISDYSGPFEASCWLKTNELEGGVWIGVIFWVKETDGIRVLAHQYSDKITGTNDWTQLSVTVDDSSYDVNDLNGIFYIERMRDSGEVWVDEAVCKQSGDSSQPAGEYRITYEYDKRANRNFSSIKLPDGTKEEQIYRYDNINRLKRTTYQDSGGPPSLKYEYTYDAVGNRTVKVETDFDSPDTSQYTYNYNTNNNQLSSITETGETYTYNDRGDLLTTTGGYTFNYDREGRLEEIIEAVAGDTNKFTFSYTSEGRRFRKIHSVDTSEVITADTTYYVYDGMFAVAELDGHLDLKSKYIYTNGMLVGRIDSSGELYQYFHDGLGSITMITDTTGSYQNLYTYDDFGDFRKKDEEVSNSYCYTGQERDENPSGLYNLRARYYASGMGRFTQEDPIWQNTVKRKLLPLWHYDYIYGSCTSTGSCGSCNKPIAPQDNNPYVYCISNPINMIDPSGLWRIPGTNWCGGDWSGGIPKKLYDMDDKEKKRLKKPVSRLDFCCMKHDYCYLGCNNAGSFNFGAPCQLKCDAGLSTCLGIASMIFPVIHPWML